MMSRPTRRAFLLGTLALGLPGRAGADGFPGGLGEVFGPRFGARSNLRDLRQHRRPGAGAMDRLHHWNEIAIDASGLDHTPVPPADDGSRHPEPRVGVDFITSDEPGKWRQDPISQNPLALGAHWGEVAPFVLQAGDQFRVPPPPDLDSQEYTAAFNEVKAVGGDGVVTPTARTADQTVAGIYWAYDATPSLCAPPRLYNKIAMQIAEQRKTGAIELARLLALINTAMADAGIAIWESKYHYEFWRPITGIRESDSDGNPRTVQDPTYSPLGAPASNLTGPNFTPPFPAYPSGHAGFGGALFQILRNFYGPDHIAFTFVSDEFNGETVDNQGNVRPLVPRSFSSLSEAEEENGQSRIYLGIHWAFDKTEGIAQGRRVADYVFSNAFTRSR